MTSAWPSVAVAVTPVGAPGSIESPRCDAPATTGPAEAEVAGTAMKSPTTKNKISGKGTRLIN
ncbi:MAG TPA: hypothetical protein VGG38_12420 [Acidimicrobiales bacterium]